MSVNTTPATGTAPPPAVPMFYVVSINKMIALMLATSNLYAFYWFYRNWSSYREASGERLIPLLRSIIPVLFMYPLLSRVDRSLTSSGRQHQWSPLMLTLGMWLVVLAGFVSGWITPTPSELAPPDSAFWIRGLIELFLYTGVMIWILCLAQRAINVHEGDPKGQMNGHITGANWVWIAVGVVIWSAFVVIMTLSFLLSFIWDAS